MSVSAYSSAAIGRGTRHFIIGKAISATVSIVVLMLLVRALSVNEYAAYVTFIAAVELAFALTFFGLPWLAARYLPEFRIHSSGPRLRKLCWNLAGVHFVIVAISCLIFAVVLDVYLNGVGLAAYTSAAKIYLLLFLVEAIGRFAREGLLGALLMQDIIQISLVLRGLVFLLLLVIASQGHMLGLELAAWAELIAALVATAYALVGLWRRIALVNPQPSSGDWVEPSMRGMWPAAVKMYSSQLLTLVYSPQMIVNMIQYFLGANSAAAFGFLRNLYDLVSRYLPATLLFNLIRPKLVASFVHAGDVSLLARHANLAGKLSMLALMPALAFVAAGGDELITRLSGNKFADIGLLFFGLMVALVPFSQRQLLETIAVATGHAGVCARAAATGLVIPLLMFWMLNSGMGLWAGVIGIGLGHLFFDAIVVYAMVRKTGFQADGAGFSNITLAGLIGYLLAVAVSVRSEGLLMLGLAGAGVGVGYSLAIWWLRPITRDELARLLGTVTGKQERT